VTSCTRNARALAALGSGLVFGAGLVVSGMTKPEKVIGFLDLFGAWDASLAFVMLGAIAVHFVAHRLVRGRSAPLLAPRFALPTRRDIDMKLVVGAAVFGVGWGLAGYCPGPGLVAAASGGGAVVFVAALLAGTWLTAQLENLAARKQKEACASC
jgi:uncharacterized membrane protein YedE/YeeE